MVDFSADQLTYDDNADIVTASGDVRMRRQGNRLRADKATWNRKTGEVRAEGRGRSGQSGRRHRLWRFSRRRPTV